MPSLDVMDPHNHSDEELAQEIEKLREYRELQMQHASNPYSQQQYVNKQRQNGFVNPTTISGSASLGVGGSGGSGMYTYSTNNTLPPESEIGPFTYAQRQMMAGRFHGGWTVRGDTHGANSTEWWFIPNSMYLKQHQSTTQMGDWQMGYDQGYEDGKTGK